VSAIFVLFYYFSGGIRKGSAEDCAP